MRKQLLLVMTVIALAFTSAGAIAKTQVFDVYGKAHDFATLKNKWIIVNYWAAWCHVCVEEIPELNKLAELTRNKPVEIFAVNYDELPAKTQKEFAEHYQINYPLLRDNPFNDRFPHEQITSLPVTYVISPTGQIHELNGGLRISDVMAIVG